MLAVLLKKTNTLVACLSLACILLFTGCGDASGDREQISTGTADWTSLQPTGELELDYADQFAVTWYDRYAWITIEDSGSYLIVPEGCPVPAKLPDETVVIRQPLQNAYLVATSAMDFICQLDGIDQFRFSGTKQKDWYIQKARQAMEDERLLYAGKYSAPDYELLLEEGCDLALESTMIYHTPKVIEQLGRLEIPVLVEHSSYESHPLGRMEWIKLYGVLLGKTEEAERLFQSWESQMQEVMDQADTGKTVAFFSIDSNGAVTVRKATDYIAKLIELAGGIYVPGEEYGEENALSTTKLQMESFYEYAKDADCIIYNSAIEGELGSIEELMEKSALLKDFAAVKSGQVFCTGKNLFQESSGMADLMSDIHRILTDADAEDLVYLRRLH